MNKVERVLVDSKKKYYDQWCEFTIGRIPYRVSNSGILQTRYKSASEERIYLTDYWWTKKAVWGLCDKFGGGYWITTLSSKQIRIHRIVAICFIGEIPKNSEVNHINGDRNNNSASNLEIVNHKKNMENLSDRTFSRPNNKGKINSKTIPEILNLIAIGYSNKKIAEIYNVNPSNISRLKNNKWFGRRKLIKI